MVIHHIHGDQLSPFQSPTSEPTSAPHRLGCDRFFCFILRMLWRDQGEPRTHKVMVVMGDHGHDGLSPRIVCHILSKYHDPCQRVFTLLLGAIFFCELLAMLAAYHMRDQVLISIVITITIMTSITITIITSITITTSRPPPSID